MTESRPPAAPEEETLDVPVAALRPSLEAVLMHGIGV